MSHLSLPPFEHALHVTNVWLKDICYEMGGDDRPGAYRALRAVLHALRDRLSVDQCAALGAQLPTLIRGIFYEGWQPQEKPTRIHTRSAFLQRVEAASQGSLNFDIENATRSVFAVLERHVSGGEMESVKCSLPADIRTLWPKSAAIEV